MDGMSFFQNEVSALTDDSAPRHSIRLAVLLAVVSVALTVSVLVGFRVAGAPPLVANEIATAPIG